MKYDAIPELFAIRAEVDRVVESLPKNLPERTAGSVEAHLQTARDSLTAAYSDLLDAELGGLRKSLADVTDADRAVAQDGRA